MSLASWSQVNGPNAPLSDAQLVAGAILYLVAFGHAISYNYNVTRSAVLAVSTSMLQQPAVLGAVFLFLRLRGEEVNRGR
jgi:hypothetical protein